MEFQIEKNIAPPEGRQTKWPFAKMQVGDSVFFPEEKVNGKAYRSAMAMGVRRGWRFLARRENEGIRIWRTE